MKDTITDDKNIFNNSKDFKKFGFESDINYVSVQTMRGIQTFKIKLFQITNVSSKESNRDLGSFVSYSVEEDQVKGSKIIANIKNFFELKVEKTKVFKEIKNNFYTQDKFSIFLPTGFLLLKNIGITPQDSVLKVLDFSKSKDFLEGLM